MTKEDLEYFVVDKIADAALQGKPVGPQEMLVLVYNKAIDDAANESEQVGGWRDSFEITEDIKSLKIK